MSDEPKSERCFKCGRDLGPLLEWKKMDTDAGPICYVCFNEAAARRVNTAPTSAAATTVVFAMVPPLPIMRCKACAGIARRSKGTYLKICP